MLYQLLTTMVLALRLIGNALYIEAFPTRKVEVAANPGDRGDGTSYGS
jgi:hypothetical protein